jgi:hypothetical protein
MSCEYLLKRLDTGIETSHYYTASNNNNYILVIFKSGLSAVFDLDVVKNSKAYENADIDHFIIHTGKSYFKFKLVLYLI